MKNFFIFLFFSFSVIAGAVILTYTKYEMFKEMEIELTHSVSIDVEKGDNWKIVAEKLERAKIIPNKWFFYFMVRERPGKKTIRQGEYEFSGTFTPKEIIEKIIAGKVKIYQVSVPEGFNKYDLDALFKRLPWIKNNDKFLEYCHDKSLLRKIGGESVDSCEGLLFPSTYYFIKNTELKTIVLTMSDYSFKILEKYQNEIKKSGFTDYEVIKLASIIEKETGVFEEQPKIASVFLNRLKNKMRLQSDPTVIYGLLPDFDGNLTKEHLQDKENKYSTYTNNGLPPTPIAFPGENAIKSVLYPDKTEYIYFVATNNGYHYFSKSLDEHNAAVRHYQKKGNSAPFVWRK